MSLKVKTKEQLIEERSKYPYMMVCDDKLKASFKRIVIEVLEDGHCLAIDADSELSFKRGESYDVLRWNHYEPIEEQKEKQYKQLTPKSSEGA